MFLGENPIHMNVLDKSDIANLVLMPGDPLRAKYIAQNFLEDAKCVTDVRNMLGFTGTYKGHKITVMSSGMGMPSMSIYAFELFHYFNVDKIIRIGTCGAVSESAKIGDLILSERVYSESNFAYTYNDFEGCIVDASENLNEKVKQAAKKLDLENKLDIGMLTTMDVFGPYIDYDRVLERIPKDLEILGEEMEAFALIHIANSMKKEATTIATVVDSKFSNVVMSAKERETSLNDMIKLALEAIIIDD